MNSDSTLTSYCKSSILLPSRSRQRLTASYHQVLLLKTWGLEGSVLAKYKTFSSFKIIGLKFLPVVANSCCQEPLDAPLDVQTATAMGDSLSFELHGFFSFSKRKITPILYIAAILYSP